MLMSEDYRMGIFDAVVLAIAYFKFDSVRIPAMRACFSALPARS
jgi:hypothetical protein